MQMPLAIYCKAALLVGSFCPGYSFLKSHYNQHPDERIFTPCMLQVVEDSHIISETPQESPQQAHIIVVGKVIVDEYGRPNEPEPKISVGGGGPQAVIGAALALASRDYKTHKQVQLKNTSSKNLPPPKQPISFMAPVGDLDFSAIEENTLLELLEPVLQKPPIFLRGRQLMTPRIRLWHEGDENEQILRWFALNDSFGDQGAGGLWGTLPSLEDYDRLFEDITCHSTTPTLHPVLHIIAEAGATAPGRNKDSRVLLDKNLRSKISFLGVEPVIFSNEDTGCVSEKDAVHCAKLLQDILKATPQSQKVVISPDMAAYQAMIADTSMVKSPNLDSWAVRNGPQGSRLVLSPFDSAEMIQVPAATLTELINPTGAGNAYAAAYTTLRGSGCGCIESACLATAIGAIFCEYPHCPPYDWQTIERVSHLGQHLESEIIREVAGIGQNA